MYLHVVLFLMALLLTSPGEASNGCPEGQHGLRGIEVHVGPQQHRIDEKIASDETAIIDALKGYDRSCALLISPESASETQSAQALCRKLGALGFKNVALVAANHRGWTLYPPGVFCESSN